MRLTRWITALAVFSLAMHAHGLEIRWNSGNSTQLSDSSLEQIAYPISMDGQIVQVASLLEIFPLLISCDSLAVSGSGGISTWTSKQTGSDLADLFARGFLVRSLIGWDLELLDTTILDVEWIEIDAEILEQRDLTVWLSWEGIPAEWVETAGIDTPNKTQNEKYIKLLKDINKN
jgi:hypothetical protein